MSAAVVMPGLTSAILYIRTLRIIVSCHPHDIHLRQAHKLYSAFTRTDRDPYG